VCWRLARQLARERFSSRAASVRLWVDDLASLRRLCHAVDASSPLQSVAGVEIRGWDPSGRIPLADAAVGDIVIEGFGVRLPDALVQAMARRSPHPVWVNLEYLSAEDWVESCHGLPSPQPNVALTKHFFFPGFTKPTGGLIVEPGIARAREIFQSDANAVAAFRGKLGLHELAQDARWISLFCYDNAALPALVEAWSASSRPVVCVVTEGRTAAQLAAIVGRPLEGGARHAEGALTIAAIPFLEQDDYDRLLWSCDANFVRGEDSFVRAQLAARPMVWQAYPQKDEAHLDKLTAFTALYQKGLEAKTASAQAAMFDAWNRQSGGAGACWPALEGHHEALAGHARAWAGRLAQGTSLAERLARFCENKIK
jgi:uncharacterized repeat protein (TIGR03837 family)